LENIEFLGHASFKIKGSKIIYTDPYEIFDEETADIILITHSHFDHLSVKDIKKISNENTTIVASKDCIDSLQNLPCYTIGLEPFQNVIINGVHIDAFPAYNINKEFHPKEKKWNGYVFELDGIRYYHPGDTDKIPEMERIKADILFLPVGGTYTMDHKEAASVVSIINPKKAIPMHYGTIVGSISDAEAFIQLVGDTGSLIPQKKL
jgi:L-ascorbate metabolism protein UlaG (beta-lactamase superfamily)